MISAAKLGKQLTTVVIVGLLLLSGYFIGNNYTTSKQQLEESLVNKLEAVAISTAAQIDGDLHEKIVKKYTKKDQLIRPIDDPLTHGLYNTLRSIKKNNKLTSDIYTLFIEEENKQKKFIWA